MQDHTQEQDSSSPFSILKKFNSIALPVLGVFGFGLYNAYLDKINTVKLADPTATSWDATGAWFSDNWDALASGSSLSGLGHLLMDSFTLASQITTDYFIPGGTAMLAATSELIAEIV